MVEKNSVQLSWINDSSTRLEITNFREDNEIYNYNIKYGDNKKYELRSYVNLSRLVSALNIAIPLYIARNTSLKLADKIVIFGNNQVSVFLSNFLFMSGFNPLLIYLSSKSDLKNTNFECIKIDKLNLKNKEIIKHGVEQSSKQYPHFFDITSNNHITNFIFEIAPRDSNINLLYDGEINNYTINTYSDIHIPGSKFRAIMTPDITMKILGEKTSTSSHCILDRSIDFSYNNSKICDLMNFWIIDKLGNI